MEKLEQIKQQIQPVLDQFNVELYEMNWQKAKKSTTLQIAIMHEDGSMDLDTCANVSEKISELLDQLDLVEEEYFLEVCSPGAERLLRNEKEVAAALGKKVAVTLKQEIKGMKEVNGILKTFSDGLVEVEYREKAVVRRLDIPYESIDKIRLAV